MQKRYIEIEGDDAEWNGAEDDKQAGDGQVDGHTTGEVTWFALVDEVAGRAFRVHPEPAAIEFSLATDGAT